MAKQTGALSNGPPDSNNPKKRQKRVARLERRWLRRAGALARKLLLGNQHWAFFRLLILLLAGFIYMMMMRRVENVPSLLLDPAFMSPAVLRHAIWPLLVLYALFRCGALYLDDLFELGDSRLALRYLLTSMFGRGHHLMQWVTRPWAIGELIEFFLGLDYPVVTIADGKILPGSVLIPGSNKQERHAREESPDSTPNSLMRIGGPGYVLVNYGNVALAERVNGPARLLEPGCHFLGRFATIRAEHVFDLRDHTRSLSEQTIITSDGITLKLKGGEVGFRIRASKPHTQEDPHIPAGGPRTEKDPYPFSGDAVWRIVSGQSVSHLGPTSWMQRAVFVAEGLAAKPFMYERLDEALRPGEHSWRTRVQEAANSPEAHRKFREIGVELLWLEPGYVELPIEASDQRVSNWQATWKQFDRQTAAEGEANLILLEEFARAEAIESMASAIRAGLSAASATVNTADIVLLRLSKLFEQLGEPGAELPSRE